MSAVIFPWAQTVSAIVSAIVVPLGIWIAYRGLNTWRHQKIDGRKIEVAEDALKHIARFRDLAFSIASGWVSGHELELIKTEYLKNFDEEKRDRVAAYAAPLRRIGEYASELNDISAHRYVCSAYFGSAAVELFDRARKVIREVEVAAEMLVTRGDGPVDADTAKLYEELRHKIWMGMMAQNPLHIETNSIVDDAVAFFSPHLKVR